MKGSQGIRRVLFWSSVLLTLLATSTIASARRAYEQEIGYFSADGTLNGSITYFCEGGKYIEGQLIGTPRMLYSMECLCVGPGDGNGWYCD